MGYTADALVPIKPEHWPAFTAGSAAANDMIDFTDKLCTPFTNMQVAQEYLATSQSDLQFRARLWTVVEDVSTINGMCEMGSTAGSFAAGALSNKIADKYMDEIMDTALTQNLYEELNMEIFKATAKADNRDPATVRGTGTIRQNVPENMKDDLWKRPERNSRPLWGVTDGPDEGELDMGSGPTNPDNSLEGGSSSDSMGQSGKSGSEPSIQPDGIITNEDDKEGGIFARCLEWLFGGGSGDCGTELVPMTPAEIQRRRDEAEDDYYMGSGNSGYCLPPDHPAFNPPMFGTEIMPPPDY